MHDVYGVKFLSRLRLNFSYLNEHKFRKGFKDRTTCMRDCGSATETTLHFLFQCQQYQAIKIKLFNGIYLIVNFYTYYYTDQNYLVLK